MRDRRWLADVREFTDRPLGMYRGLSAAEFPESVELRLTKLGFIEREFPHNSVHHDRLVITDAGRQALSATEGGDT